MPSTGDHPTGQKQDTGDPGGVGERRSRSDVKRPWYRSLWLIPAVALVGMVVLDLSAGATVVVGAAAIATALALSVVVLAVPAVRDPTRRALVVVGLVLAATAAIVVLQRRGVQDALEPTDDQSPARASTTPERHPQPQRLRGSVVRAGEVKAHDLRDIDLSAATLDGLDLRGRLLDRVHLEGASLAGVDLRGAQLVKAHLEGAVLRGARLGKACLLGAHLDGADVTGATFGGADVTAVTGAAAARRGAASWPRRKASRDVCR